VTASQALAWVGACCGANQIVQINLGMKGREAVYAEKQQLTPAAVFHLEASL